MTDARLADARLYLCTDSRRRQRDLPDFLDAVLSGGVDIIQLREKHLEAGEELNLLAVFGEACRRHGKLLAVNDRADVAVTAGADVLHVGQQDLPPAAARRIVGPDMIIGLSSHGSAEAAAAAEHPDVDYFCLGPIWATPTKPGRPHTTLQPVGELARHGPERPWFAIGGIDEGNLNQVLDAGAERIVVVRALTESADPYAAASRLADRLATAAAGQDAASARSGGVIDG